MRRLGLLGPVVRLHRRIDPRWSADDRAPRSVPAASITPVGGCRIGSVRGTVSMRSESPPTR